MKEDFFIQGFVKAEMKKKVTYKPSVQIRTTCQVISAAYTCLAGGTPAFCKRVFALLHAINDYIAKKLYEAPTERLQTWHQPKPVKMVPQTSEEVFMHEPAIAVENEIGFDLNVERLSEYLFPAGKLHLLSLELWVSFVSALP
ncbi:hypothetical protein TNCV_1027091 [Trichonephila clavipes]|nr:hypothetical protein TNCV_1027091 [Trichonephila clavipes]